MASTEREFDVIVVGLGPAGSTTAYELARRGHRVIGFDRAKMPRYKPCGGGLSARVRTILGEVIESTAEQVVKEIVFTYRAYEPIRFTTSDPIMYTVSREKFDDALMRRAEAAGANTHDGERVLTIERTDHHFAVRTDGGRYRGRYIVGADGVNGVAARLLGIVPNRDIAVAIESEAQIPPAYLDASQGRVHIDLGSVPSGYGWVFPKKDHWSLGVGSVAARRWHVAATFSQFVDRLGVGPILSEQRRQGYRIPLFSDANSPISAERSLLVGDAASFVDPFTGEGIYYAVRSGQIAAEALHEQIVSEGTDLSHYRRRIGAELYPQFQIAQIMSRLAYWFPRAFHTLLRRKPTIGMALVEILQGKRTYRGSVRALLDGILPGVLRRDAPAGETRGIVVRFQHSPNDPEQTRLAEGAVP